MSKKQKNDLVEVINNTKTEFLIEGKKDSGAPVTFKIGESRLFTKEKANFFLTHYKGMQTLESLRARDEKVFAEAPKGDDFEEEEEEAE